MRRSHRRNAGQACAPSRLNDAVGERLCMDAAHDIGLLDCVYRSAVCYTTLGLGDVAPVGNIRFLTGMESLTGFMLIGCSVSFTYLEMVRFWRG
jgi:hypothetical protein